MSFELWILNTANRGKESSVYEDQTKVLLSTFRIEAGCLLHKVGIVAQRDYNLHDSSHSKVALD